MATTRKKAVTQATKKAAPKSVSKAKKAESSTTKVVTKKSPAKRAPKTVKKATATVVKDTKTAAKKVASIPSFTSVEAELPVRLQAVIDKSELTDLLYSIGRGLDRLDEPLLRSAFHPDASIDMGPSIFQGSGSDYVHWVLGVMGRVQESHHMISNVRVTLEHDVAFVESYCQAHFRVDKPTGREDVFIGSRFLDRAERRPSNSSGVWKIVHRKQIIDWVRTEAVSDLFYHQNPDALWSYRTKTDPSYQMRQFPGNQTTQKIPAFMSHRYDSGSVKF